MQVFFSLNFGWSLGTLSANGKSIGEVRAFEELKVQETPNVANAFSSTLN